MKRVISAVAVAVVAVAVFTIVNCGPQKPRLYIYNWADYITDEVLEEFQRRYGIRVIFDMYASNEEMYAKLKAGGARYDLVFPSGDFVSIMTREGMLKEIDKSRIPNFANLDTTILPKLTFDPDSRFSVPYAMGMAGVTVNTERVPEFEDSWRIFENPAIKGRFTLLDDMREVLGAALKMLGYSINSKNPAELNEAKELVMEWRRGAVKFDAEAFGKGFAAGEFWAVHGYVENVFVELDDDMRAQTRFFIPQEGGPMYMDNMVILRNARNIDAAYKFINFIHEPEIYAKIMDYFELPSINVPARKHITVTPHYQIEDMQHSEFIEDLGEYLDMYNRIWQEIRIGR